MKTTFVYSETAEIDLQEVLDSVASDVQAAALIPHESSRGIIGIRTGYLGAFESIDNQKVCDDNLSPNWGSECVAIYRGYHTLKFSHGCTGDAVEIHGWRFRSVNRGDDVERARQDYRTTRQFTRQLQITVKPL